MVCLFLFYFLLLVFIYWEDYKSRGQIWKDWEMSGLGCMVWNSQTINKKLYIYIIYDIILHIILYSYIINYTHKIYCIHICIKFSKN